MKRLLRALGWLALGYVIGAWVMADYDLKQEAAWHGGPRAVHG